MDSNDKPTERRNRRRFLTQGGTVLAAAALAACGGQAVAPEATNAPAADAPTSAPVSATSAPAAATSAPVVATSAPVAATSVPAQTSLKGQLVLSLADTVPDDVAQALTAAYKKSQPEVELLWENPGVDAAGYGTWLSTQLSANEIRPDIVSGNYAGYNGYVNFDRYRSTVNPYSGDSWDSTLDWDFFAFRDGSGARTMLPTRAVHVMWFYNKDIFKKVGVEPPTTWAEFVTVCEKIAAAGITPVSANFKWQVPQWLVSIYSDPYHVNWVETVRAQPGDWNYNPEVDDKFVFDPKNPDIHSSYTYNPVRYYAAVRDGKISYDTPEMVDFIRNMSAIFPKYAVPDFFVIGDPYPPFLTQQAAIMCNGTWALPSLIGDLSDLSPERLEELGIDSSDVKTFEWGTFENPSMEGPLIKGPVRSVESATGEYLSIIDKEQAQTELALDFLQFWTSTSGYQTWIDASVAHGSYAPGGPPKVRGVKEPAEIEAIFQDIKFIGNAEANYNNFMTWGSPKVSQTSSNLYKEALEGKITPENFAKQFQELVMAAFPDTMETLNITNDNLDNPAIQPTK